jgi:hypothetical protein
VNPLDIAIAALVVISFVLSVVLLAIVTLILEALAFAIGLGRQDWRSRY